MWTIEYWSDDVITVSQSLHWWSWVLFNTYWSQISSSKHFNLICKLVWRTKLAWDQSSRIKPILDRLSKVWRTEPWFRKSEYHWCLCGVSLRDSSGCAGLKTLISLVLTVRWFAISRNEVGLRGLSQTYNWKILQ